MIMLIVLLLHTQKILLSEVDLITLKNWMNMVRGEIIQPDPHGRLRVADILCVGHNGININDVFDTRFELQIRERHLSWAAIYRQMTLGT